MHRGVECLRRHAAPGLIELFSARTRDLSVELSVHPTNRFYDLIVSRAVAGRREVSKERSPRCGYMPPLSLVAGGGRCRIRTCVGVSRRIYSPLPLAARATCLVRGAGYNEGAPAAKTAGTASRRDGLLGAIHSYFPCKMSVWASWNSTYEPLPKEGAHG